MARASRSEAKRVAKCVLPLTIYERHRASRAPTRERPGRRNPTSSRRHIYVRRTPHMSCTFMHMHASTHMSHACTLIAPFGHPDAHSLEKGQLVTGIVSESGALLAISRVDVFILTPGGGKRTNPFNCEQHEPNGRYATSRSARAFGTQKAGESTHQRCQAGTARSVCSRVR